VQIFNRQIKMSFASNLKNDKLYQTNERYEHLSDTSNFWVSNQALINQYKPVNLGIVWLIFYKEKFKIDIRNLKFYFK